MTQKYDDSSIEILPNDATRCYYDALAGEVRTKGTAHMVESYVYTIGGTCVVTKQGAHDAVDMNAMPAGAYFYRGVDAMGNNVICKFVK